MRLGLIAVLSLGLLTACVSREQATTTATTTTQPEPTNPVKDSAVVHVNVPQINTMLTACPPGGGAAQRKCDWYTLQATISDLIHEITAAVANSPHPQAYAIVTLTEASSAMNLALARFRNIAMCVVVRAGHHWQPGPGLLLRHQ